MSNIEKIINELKASQEKAPEFDVKRNKEAKLYWDGKISGLQEAIELLENQLKGD